MAASPTMSCTCTSWVSIERHLWAAKAAGFFSSLLTTSSAPQGAAGCSAAPKSPSLPRVSAWPTTDARARSVALRRNFTTSWCRLSVKAYTKKSFLGRDFGITILQQDSSRCRGLRRWCIQDWCGETTWSWGLAFRHCICTCLLNLFYLSYGV